MTPAKTEAAVIALKAEIVRLVRASNSLSLAILHLQGSILLRDDPNRFSEEIQKTQSALTEYFNRVDDILSELDKI